MKSTIDMALEAGFYYPVPADGFMGLAYDSRERKETGGSLKAFEALVRADAIAGEREACAKVADRYVMCDPIAKAIRARSNT
jgi:hypothetical protein